MASPSINIRFKINFQLTNTPIDIKWTDTTDYPALGLVTANMRLILWVVDGGGTTIYKNAGYSGSDFSSPDIDRSSSDNKDGIELDTDVNGNPVTGSYIFYYKAKDVVSGSVYMGNKTYDFQYSVPAVDIDQSYSCRTSELTSVDSTEYDVEGVTPTITRTHTITKPSGSGANDPGSTTDASRTIGGGSTPATRLWLGEWVTAITSAISYDMETWDGSAWIVIGDSITGSESITVTCTDSINSIITAISALFDRWVTAKEEDYTEAARLGNIVLEITALWMEYEDALRNGTDYASFATEMSVLLNAEGLITPSATVTTAQIVPWGEGSVSATGNTISFVSTTPTGGNSGDVAIGEDGSSVEWNVYQNVGGTWTLKGNMESNSAPLLHNDVTDTSCTNSTSEQDLKTYNMPATTLEATGKMVQISALIYANSASLIDKELILYFGSEKVASHVSTLMPNGYYLLTANVYRTTSVAHQTYESHVEIYGTPSSKINLSVSTATEALGSVVVIKVSCDKDVPGVAGDIICKYLRVQKF